MCRSFFWWLGLIAYFQTPGCVVGVALVACCAWAGTPLLGIFGPPPAKRDRPPTPGKDVKQPKQRLSLRQPPAPVFSGERDQDERVRRLENCLTWMESEGLSQRDRDWIELTGARPETEVGRSVREAKWIKGVSDWLKGHGWSGLTQGTRSKCYLILFWRSRDPDTRFQLKPFAKPTSPQVLRSNATSPILLCAVFSNRSRSVVSHLGETVYLSSHTTEYEYRAFGLQGLVGGSLDPVQ